MTKRLLILDAYCCQGGATRGYHLRWPDAYIVGVDIEPQPHYIGNEFHQGDALAFIERYGHVFDMRHASPPCQKRTKAQKIQGNEHPALIAPTRALFQAIGAPT